MRGSLTALFEHGELFLWGGQTGLPVLVSRLFQASLVAFQTRLVEVYFRVELCYLVQFLWLVHVFQHSEETLTQLQILFLVCIDDMPNKGLDCLEVRQIALARAKLLNSFSSTLVSH